MILDRTGRVMQLRNDKDEAWGIDTTVEQPGFDVSEFENKLHSELERLKQGMENIKQKTFSMSEKQSLAEDSAYDQHPGDLGTETFERGKDLGLKDGLETNIARVRGATADKAWNIRLLPRCKQPIPVERLELCPS